MREVNGVPVKIEEERGCGYRKVGGIYLVGELTDDNCCILPHPTPVCPTCQAGIKPARGWTWTHAGSLLQDATPSCSQKEDLYHPCPAIRMRFGTIESAGVIWVGETFYAAPEIFLREARAMGISRKIGAVPRGFEVGRTWVLLAHRHAVPQQLEIGKPALFDPGIFAIYCPTAIEVVVDERTAMNDEALDAYRKRGLTPVIVEPKMKQSHIDEIGEEE